MQRTPSRGFTPAADLRKDDERAETETVGRNSAAYPLRPLASPTIRAAFHPAVRDYFRNYPGLVAKLLAIRQRACHDLHTIEDQQRIQWLSQATFGALDIYQHGVSICAVSREEILEEIDDWLASQHDNLAAALFAPLITGD